MGVRNYLIPVGAMTLTDQKDYRLMALAAGLERADFKSIGNLSNEVPGYKDQNSAQRRVSAIVNWLRQGNWPVSIDVRDAQPILDYGCALDQWNTAALAVVGTAYSCYQAIAAPILAANKLMVCYAVSLEDVPMNVSRLVWRSGGALGNTLAVFDLEQLVPYDEWKGYFSEPIVIDPTQTHACQVLARIATGLIGRVQLSQLVFEPSGQVVA